MGFLKRKDRIEPVEITRSLQEEHLRLFHDVAREITSTLSLETVLTTIMTRMAQFFGPERWSMLLVDEEKNDLFYAIAVGEDSESLKGLRVPMGEGVAGWVAGTGNPLVVPNVNLDARWKAYAAAHPELNIQSIACVPVRSADKVLGAIQLLNSKFDLLGEYSLSFLRMLCDFAAIAIQNADRMKQIRELSITDDVTGLFNARHLYATLEEVVREQEKFSLLFIDLDKFKSVNDTYGHLIGSRLLAEVGNLLKRFIGPTNAGFRYGGDEFVVMLRDMDKQRAIQFTSEIYKKLRTTPFLEAAGMSLHVKGSFGLASYPEDGGSIQEIIRAADTMMYDVKAKTRDNLAVAGLGLMFGEQGLASQPESLQKLTPSLLDMVLAVSATR
ncbi:MAG: sensor domain-containing diguanylate cyclase [Acidobacteria bacterium]|nr:sensor domain-containing diguanylate cyclase [Acidobacteriota bacterium]